jgi:hypothetical protein
MAEREEASELRTMGDFGRAADREAHPFDLHRVTVHLPCRQPAAAGMVSTGTQPERAFQHAGSTGA